jgi:hypothetical protein
MRTALIAAIVVLLFTAGSAVAVKLYVLDDPQGNPAFRQSSWGATQAGSPGGSGCPGSSGPGGCASSAGGGGGSCCGGAGAGTVDLEKVRNFAVEYYVEKYNDGDVTCEVRDFGCHMEAYIIKDGNVVKTFGVSGGRMYEI